MDQLASKCQRQRVPMENFDQNICHTYCSNEKVVPTALHLDLENADVDGKT